MKSYEALEIARAEIGTKENPPNSNNVKYNTWYYGHEVSGSQYPWCCAFIEWIFRNTGLITKTASCTTLYTNMKTKGQVVTTPKPGDLVFFNFSAKTKCEVMKHIGIAETINSDGSIYSIEGNTSSSGSQDNGGIVMRKKRKPSCIMAYARPSYSDAKKESKPTVTTGKYPTIQKGSEGDLVLFLQQILKNLGIYKDKVDGIFGGNTDKAVREYQKLHSLEVDGIVGQNTWNEILKGVK